MFYNPSLALDCMVLCLLEILVDLRARRPSSPLCVWRVCCGKSLTEWQVDCPAYLNSLHDDEDHPVSPAKQRQPTRNRAKLSTSSRGATSECETEQMRWRTTGRMLLGTTTSALNRLSRIDGLASTSVSFFKEQSIPQLCCAPDMAPQNFVLARNRAPKCACVCVSSPNVEYRAASHVHEHLWLKPFTNNMDGFHLSRGANPSVVRQHKRRSSLATQCSNVFSERLH